MGSSKIKENHNREKLKKMKETVKRQSKKDQGSPIEKKNIKWQDKEHQNVLENNLAEPNKYNKRYQMRKKTHILDVLNRFRIQRKQ